jgi:heme/copper-type cytochrome/quinol oxidase subunit 2
MTLVAAGYGAIVAGLAYVLIVLALPTLDEPGAPSIASFLIFVAIASIIGLIGAVSVVWSGARRRAWFWLFVLLPGLLILLRNVRLFAYDITHPANTNPFLAAILVLSGGLAVVFGGITAFREVRHGRPVWTRTGRAGWVSVAVIGVVVGAATTSLLAGSASAGRAGVAEAPTVTGIITAENTRFVETSLHMENGEVLGLFVSNKDDIGHSFDIDSLDIHVQLPPNSTTAVAIKPTRPGSLEFYCSVPGHRDTGMVGTIDVG